MTVSSTSPLIVYDYTGVGVYTFPFRIFEDTDLVITHDTDDGQGTLLINQVDYLVGIIDEIEGGNVEITNTVITGGTLEIRRQLPVTQEVDWVNNDPLDAEILEISFDRIIMILQEFYDRIDSIFLNFSFQGTWTPNTYYDQYNIVLWDEKWWVANENFTSGDEFDENNWNMMFDFSSLYELLDQACSCATQACECADAARQSETNAEAYREQAAASEANAAISETHAANCAKSAFDDAKRAEDAAERAENIIGQGDRVDAIDEDNWTGTAGQTTFPITNPAPATNLFVFLNSRKMRYIEDFTVDNELSASEVIFNVGVASGDEVDIVSFNTFDITGDESRFYTEHITKTVGATAADFPTINAAFAWIAANYPAGNTTSESGYGGGKQTPAITLALQSGTHVLNDGAPGQGTRLMGFLGFLNIVGEGEANTFIDGITNSSDLIFSHCRKVTIDSLTMNCGVKILQSTKASVGSNGSAPIAAGARDISVDGQSTLQMFSNLSCATVYLNGDGYINLQAAATLTTKLFLAYGHLFAYGATITAPHISITEAGKLSSTGVVTLNGDLVDVLGGDVEVTTLNINASRLVAKKGGVLTGEVGTVTIDATVVQPNAGVLVEDGARLNLKDLTVDVTPVDDAFKAINGGRIDLGPDTTINDVPAGKFGFFVDTGGEIFADTPTITLDGGAESNVPYGERQPRGEIIFNGTAIPSLPTEFLTADVTKTVGAGQDFETLWDAFEWLATVRYPVGPVPTANDGGSELAKVTLSLIAGAHFFTGAPADQIRLAGFKGRLDIVGQGSGSTTIENNKAGYDVGFRFRECGTVRFKALTYNTGLIVHSCPRLDLDDDVLIPANLCYFSMSFGSRVSVYSATVNLSDAQVYSGSIFDFGLGSGTASIGRFNAHSADIQLSGDGDITIGSIGVSDEGSIVSNAPLLNITTDPTIRPYTTQPVIHAARNGKVNLVCSNINIVHDPTLVYDTVLAEVGSEINLVPSGTFTVSGTNATKAAFNAVPQGTIKLNKRPTITGDAGFTDYATPPGEVQPDGSIIFDGATAPPSTEVLTEDVTKTVGAGQDFETLWDAFEWLATVRFPIGPVPTANDGGSEVAEVTLALTDTDHFFTGAPGDYIRLSNFKGRLHLQGVAMATTAINGTGKQLRFNGCYAVKASNLTFKCGLGAYYGTYINAWNNVSIDDAAGQLQSSNGSSFAVNPAGMTIESVNATNGGVVSMYGNGDYNIGTVFANSSGRLMLRTYSGSIAFGRLQCQNESSVTITATGAVNMVGTLEDNAQVILSGGSLATINAGADSTFTPDQLANTEDVIYVAEDSEFTFFDKKLTIAAIPTGKYGVNVKTNSRASFTGGLEFTAPDPGAGHTNIPVASPQEDGSVIYDGSPTPIFVYDTIEKTIGPTGDFATIQEGFDFAMRCIPVERGPGAGGRDGIPYVKLTIQADTTILLPQDTDTILARCACRLHLVGENTDTSIIKMQQNSLSIEYCPHLIIGNLTIDGGSTVQGTNGGWLNMTFCNRAHMVGGWGGVYEPPVVIGYPTISFFDCQSARLELRATGNLVNQISFYRCHSSEISNPMEMGPAASQMGNFYVYDNQEHKCYGLTGAKEYRIFDTQIADLNGPIDCGLLRTINSRVSIYDALTCVTNLDVIQSIVEIDANVNCGDKVQLSQGSVGIQKSGFITAVTLSIYASQFESSGIINVETALLERFADWSVDYNTGVLVTIGGGATSKLHIIRDSRFHSRSPVVINMGNDTAGLYVSEGSSAMFIAAAPGLTINGVPAPRVGIGVYNGGTVNLHSEPTITLAGGSETNVPYGQIGYKGEVIRKFDVPMVFQT